MACDAQARACYSVGRTSTPDREDAMRRLMVVIAIFGVIACSGTDSQDDGAQEAPACESHDDCGTDYCVTTRTLSCDSGSDLEYNCIPCDDPPCKPGAICDSGETCKPEDACTEEYLDEKGDDCQLLDAAPAKCMPCYDDSQCSGEQVCHYNACLR